MERYSTLELNSTGYGCASVVDQINYTLSIMNTKYSGSYLCL